MKMTLELLLHTRTALAYGCKIENSPEHVATELCYAKKGDQITIKDNTYVFAIGTYALKRDLTFKETYCYLPESAWVTYNKDLRPSDYSSGPYTFKEDCYYKICLKKSGGEEMEEADIAAIREKLLFSPHFRTQNDDHQSVKPCFHEEIRQTIASVKAQTMAEEDLKLIVLTDTHHVLNGPWPDTAKNIEAVVRAARPDAIIHLGDLTDGILPKEKTLRLADEVIQGLKKNDVPLYMTLGNHDANYFWNNPEVLSLEEQAKAYLDRDKPYYYVDVKRRRLIFLSAYDNTNVHRYGFLDEEVLWLAQVLRETDKQTKVMIFSHDAPLARLDYWSDTIYNGDSIIEILEKDHREKGRILCFIHGHTHGDYIYEGLSFPIVSIGCNKCEDFTDYKPEGAKTWARAFDEVSQDLWDYVLVSEERADVRFIRFGAGEDRSIS